MSAVIRSFNQTYQLVLSDDGRGVAETIEFEASGPDAALFVAQRQCRGREAELFENQRSLGRVQCSEHGGYWVLSPPEGAARVAQSPPQGA